MVNRTRVLMPPPVAKMKMTVKQRPGMNYPRPVNHVKVSEVNRATVQVVRRHSEEGSSQAWRRRALQRRVL